MKRPTELRPWVLIRRNHAAYPDDWWAWLFLVAFFGSLAYFARSLFFMIGFFAYAGMHHLVFHLILFRDHAGVNHTFLN